MTEEQKQAVRDAVAEALGDAYDCTRVWGAWGCSTMSADDFSRVAEDDSRVAEIADAAIGAMPAMPPDGCVYVTKELLVDYNAMRQRHAPPDFVSNGDLEAALWRWEQGHDMEGGEVDYRQRLYQWRNAFQASSAAPPAPISRVEIWRELEPFLGKDVPEKEVVLLADVKAALAPVSWAEPDWRELLRRCYVELFHCDQQMRSVDDEEGEPYFTQGATVRDILRDAKAALEAKPAQPELRADGGAVMDSVYNLVAHAIMYLDEGEPGNAKRGLTDALALLAAQPKCQTCNDNGMIGGPSYYQPDEGGEPCPDCATPEPVSINEGGSEPIYQLQRADGSWIDQTEQSYRYNLQSASNKVRIVYAAPQPSAKAVTDVHESDWHDMMSAFNRCPSEQSQPHKMRWIAAEFRRLIALRAQLESPAASTQEDGAVACKRCGGSRLVDDGEITGSGGVEFENGPVRCVKDCPDCATPQPSAKTLTDEQILALNHGERYFSESPSKYPEAGHGTQYHCGAPGLLKFARALLAAQPSEDKLDAERYRWLRGKGWFQSEVDCYVKETKHLDEMDAAIDAAIAKGEGS